MVSIKVTRAISTKFTFCIPLLLFVWENKMDVDTLRTHIKKCSFFKGIAWSYCPSYRYFFEAYRLSQLIPRPTMTTIKIWMNMEKHPSSYQRYPQKCHHLDDAKQFSILSDGFVVVCCLLLLLLKFVAKYKLHENVKRIIFKLSLSMYDIALYQIKW